MKKIFTAVIAGLLLSAGCVYAADTKSTSPSFDYVQVLAESQNLPVTNGYGVDVAGSKTLGDVFFATAEWERGNLNVATADQFRVGLGARFNLDQYTTAYGEAYALRENISFKDWTALKDANSWGYGLEAGLRHNISDLLEVRGAIETERVTRDSAWTTYGVVGAQLNLTQNFAVVADAKFHSTTERVYQAGLRYSF